MNVLDYRRKVDALKAERGLLERQLEEEQNRLEALKLDAEDLDKARAFIQQVALETQETLRVRLEALVTTALRAVFPDKDLSFSVTFESKRGRTEAILEIYTDGILTDVMESHGGGVIDVVSFALRVAFWSISKNRSVMVLDEPLKFLSKGLMPNAVEMVKMISEKLCLQIIIVSHIEEFLNIADRVFLVERKGGISVVRSTT